MKRKYLMGLLMAVAMVGAVPNTVQATEVSEAVAAAEVNEAEEMPVLKVTGDVVIGDYTYNFSNEGVVVKGYNGEEKNITIPTAVIHEGDTYKIRSVANYAFENNTTIRNVVIPEGITTLGAGAFRNCTNLESVVIKGDLTDCADRSADGSWNRDFDNSVFFNAGANATSFKVTFGDDVTRIPKFLFATGRDKGDGQYCHVTDVEIGKGVTEIAQQAFFNCHDLKNITFGDKTKTIGFYAFGNTSSLKNVVLSNSIITLEEGAFADAVALESVTFGKNLTTIGKYAFLNDAALEEVTISDKVSTIGIGAFENCTGMSKVTLSNSVSTLDVCAFKNCTGLENIVINSDIADCQARSADGAYDRDTSQAVFFNAGANAASLKVTFGDEVTRIPAFLFATGREKGDGRYCHVTDVEIGKGVTEIAQQAFYNCHDLKNITFGDKTKTIGFYAFGNTSSLKNLVLSDSIITLEEGAFANAAALESVTFGKNLTTIGKYAFHNDVALEEVTISDKVATIGVGAFENCTSMSKLILSNSVSALEVCAFKNCTGLENIVINGDIADCQARSGDGAYDRDVDNAVFFNAGANADSLKVTFGDEVTRIPAFLFATGRTKGDDRYCHVTDVEIGKGVTEVAQQAFYNCHDLKNITFGNKTKTVGYYAFGNTSSLKNVVLSDSITTLEEGAFANGAVLESVTFGKNLTTIGKYAFLNDAALEEVTISEKVATIGVGAFENCTGLTKLTLSNSVSALEVCAFKNCTGLENIVINSDIADCQERSGNGSYDWDTSHAVFFNAGANADSLKVTFGKDVTRIPAYLFATGRDKGSATYAHVSEVVMSDSIKEIGAGAFRNCHDLKKIQYSSALITIGNAAFSNCESIPSIELSNKITAVGDYAFENCAGATEIILSTRLETLNTGVFMGCNSVKQVEIPRSVTGIGTNAFTNCSKLQKVYIPSNVTFIAGDSFNNTGELTICGTKGAYAETYANEKQIKFEEVDFVEDVFPDVKAKDWFVYAVQYAYDNGIMKGKADGTFAPNGTLTRAEFATVLYNKEGKPSVTFKDTFKDVKKKDWYASPIIWANQMKIASGYGTTFGVADPITREQLALMLYKYAKLKNYDISFKENSLDSFADKGKQSSYATEALQWAVTHGVMSGKGSNLDPQGKATRGECASMIMKLDSIFED